MSSEKSAEGKSDIIEFKRMNAKKFIITYSDPINPDVIRDFLQTKSIIDSITIETKGDLTIVTVVFNKKINVTNHNYFKITVEGKDFFPTVQTGLNKNDATIRPVKSKTAKVENTLTRDRVLQIVLLALTNREDEQYITILKEDPSYQLLEKLGLSIYHAISIIIHGLYVSPEFQELKLETVKNKMIGLKFLNLKSEETLRESVMTLNAGNTRHLLNIIRGVE